MDHEKPPAMIKDRLKDMSPAELTELCGDIRKRLIETVSANGGHLASNLGAVELTVALHRVFDTPKDKIVWDVGHQSYVHKMLTGRWDAMDTLRQHGGLSGFPKRAESEHDMYDSGHSGTSVSAALGYATARDLKGEDYSCIAVIGDGAMTGGVAFEALNSAGSSRTPLIVVLNDNTMSIGRNVGGMSVYLQRLRMSRSYQRFKKGIKGAADPHPGLRSFLSRFRDRIKALFLPEQLFEELGLKYYGPIDGHDISTMCRFFESAREMDRPVLIHVVTKKGRGFEPAERNPEKFHGVSSFDAAAASPDSVRDPRSWSDRFGQALLEEARADERIVAVHAAMAEGTGLCIMKSELPERVFDAGIAEQHAVSFSAGLALNGMKPVAAIYSTFLQRAYDQVITEVCLMDLPVVFGVDRAGVTGRDGETHQGVFDIAYLSSMPNMTLYSPADAKDLKELLHEALSLGSPCALRYPRGKAEDELGEYSSGSEDAFLLLCDGASLKTANEAARLLTESGFPCDARKLTRLKPLDRELLDSLMGRYGRCAVLEDGSCEGGIGMRIASFYGPERVLGLAWPDRFIEHGSPEELRRIYGMDPESIAEKIRDFRGR
ncbi:MAG: 1-deoxy-D-xylulose-5-phosphate synthase [Firmicutes bacterium]|nr:1-deoxy-D-xylulose-5-phosphate synthase [Bacillota bacterium]